MIPAVVMGSGYGGGTALSVIRNLGRHGIPVTYVCSDSASLAAYSRYARCVRAPKVTENPAGFREVLLAEGGAERPALIAVSDAEVLFQARNRDALLERFRFHSMPADRLIRLQDKHHQCQIAHRAGLMIPRTVVLDSAEAARDVATWFTFPVFAKPKLSYQRAGLKKGELFRSKDEWQRGLPALMKSSTVHLVQEVIPGPSEDLFQVSLYRDGAGRTLASSVTSKIRDYPRQFGIGTAMELVHRPDLVKLAEQFVAAAGYTGIANVEFKFDRRIARPVFLEINTRYFFPHELSARGGVHFPYIHYRDLIGEAAAPPPQSAAGMRWASLGLDVRSALEAMHDGELKFADWVKSYRGVRAEAFFAADDWRPFLCYLLGLAHIPVPRWAAERGAHAARTAQAAH